MDPALCFEKTKLDKVNSTNFVALYIQLCVSGADPKAIGDWLVQNAKYMTENMFDDANNDWLLLEPVHILALRALTPSYVFTNAAGLEYLARVSGDKVRMNLAQHMFAVTDFDLVTNLMPDLRSQVLSLVQLAYRKKTRNPDTRVLSLIS
jgi:hypothetical protein